jgi:ParB/RepB/Spo0J family partition protein
MENYKNIKISDLEIKTRGVRTRPVDKGIDTLAEHIKVHGLLNPLVVTENDDGKYEIISGERRFKAIMGLNWSEIPCHIVSVTDEYDKDSIRLGEQLTSEPLSVSAAIELCNNLYTKYFDMEIVAKKTGISKQLIKRYVKYARLPPLVQDNIGAIHPNPKTAIHLAVEAADALGWNSDNDVSEDDVLEVAKALAQKKIKLENDTIVPNVKHKIYKIVLGDELDEKLRHAANQNATSPEELIIDSIESSLSKILD